jgi:hypothetical protein
MDGAHALVGDDDGVGRVRRGLARIVGFKRQGGVFELAAQDSDLPRRVNGQRYAVAGDSTNLNGDVVSDVDFFADFPA